MRGSIKIYIFKEFIYGKFYLFKNNRQRQTNIFLVSQDREYYLFTQKFHRGVKAFFHNKVLLKDALDISKSRHDTALIKTMTKLPIYIKYIEKEYGIAVMETTIKKKAKTRYNSFGRYGFTKSCEYQVA